MKINTQLQHWFTSALFGLILACSTLLGLAQVTNNPNTFDKGTSIDSATVWWGTVNVSWDGTQDANNNPNSGSMRFDCPFIGAGGEQFMMFLSLETNATWDGNIRIDATTYTNMAFDIRVPPGTPPTTNGDYGPLTYGFLTRNDSWSFGTIWLNNYTIPLSATNWTHVNTPFANNLPNLNIVCGWYFDMWSNGAYTNAAHFNIDNLAIQAPTVVVSNPPPTLGFQQATPGLNLISTSTSGSGGRQNIYTENPSYSWINSPTSTTYAVTIKQYPPYAAYPNFETHVFLVPAGSLMYGPHDTSVDWNSTNLVYVQIANNANGSGYGHFMWKTNAAGSFGGQIFGSNEITVNSSTILGTWTIAFNQNSNVTFTAPDGSSNNFVLPAQAVASFTDPNGMYAYFGIMPNNSVNVGQGAVISEIKIAGAVDGSGNAGTDIDDTFATSPLDPDTWLVDAADANGVVVVPQDPQFWLSWSLPDTGFTLQYSEDVSAPAGNWGDPNGLNANVILLGTKKALLLDSSMFSTDQMFFQLVKTLTPQ